MTVTTSRLLASLVVVIVGRPIIIPLIVIALALIPILVRISHRSLTPAPTRPLLGLFLLNRLIIVLIARVALIERLSLLMLLIKRRSVASALASPGRPGLLLVDFPLGRLVITAKCRPLDLALLLRVVLLVLTGLEPAPVVHNRLVLDE
jgi:hypothetical protein